MPFVGTISNFRDMLLSASRKGGDAYALTDRTGTEEGGRVNDKNLIKRRI